MSPISDAYISNLVAEIRNQSGKKGYSWLPGRIFKEITGSPDEQNIMRQVLSILLSTFTVEHSSLSIPGSINNLYDRELTRIKSLADNYNDASLKFDLDVRKKDIAILTFRLIPVGAEFAEPWSGISRRRVFSSKFSQFFKAAHFFILKKNGFQPYFQLHMHQESHQDFHEAGWKKTYIRLAELLENNPSHKGWFSSSWFVDPALQRISPHLSYLRTVPEDHGGGIFYLEDDPKGLTGALATSKTRRGYFESGHYVPKIYLRVWPRSPAIAWRKDQQKKIEMSN